MELALLTQQAYRYHGGHIKRWYMSSSPRERLTLLGPMHQQ